MSDIKEFPVDSRDFFSKSMYLAKEFLNTNQKIKIVANSRSANEGIRLAETLRRLGYIDFDDIQTETIIRDGRRQTRIVITVHNTPDFDKLYKEYADQITEHGELGLAQKLYEAMKRDFGAKVNDSRT